MSGSEITYFIHLIQYIVVVVMLKVFLLIWIRRVRWGRVKQLRVLVIW